MSKKEIPPEDKIVLSPIEQYIVYGKFPYFMIIHILLLVFNTLQVTIILSEFNEYFRAQEKSFLNTLISTSPKETRNYPKKTYLYTIKDIQNHLNESMDKMLEANYTFFNTIIYLDKNYREKEEEFFTMKVKYKTDLSKLNKEEYPIPLKENYTISPEYLGPFNTNYSDDDIKKYINSISLIYIEYNLKMYIARFYKQYKECFIWNLLQIYDFRQRAHFTVGLEINRQQCGEKTSFSKGEIIMISHMWIHIIVLFVAVISVIFCLYSFHITNELKRYRKALIEEQKGKKIKNPKILKEIETIEKVSNKWELILIFANLFQILGSLVHILRKANTNYSTSLVIAIGIFLCYISVGKYMNFNSNHALFFRAFSNLWPIFFPFILATIPIFIAFTLAGLGLFWNSEKYTNVSDVIKDLFTLIWGVFFNFTISDFMDREVFLGTLYCYSYYILFNIVVKNVFNSIVQTAFVKAKLESKSNWIYNSLMKESYEVTNENLRNLPDIETMSPEEIIEEMQKRLKAMNVGLNKCLDLIEDVDNKEIDDETKISLKKVIYKKVEKIDKKFEFILLAWKIS